MTKIYFYHENYAIFLIILISMFMRQFLGILFHWKTEEFSHINFAFWYVANIFEIIF